MAVSEANTAFIAVSEANTAFSAVSEANTAFMAVSEATTAFSAAAVSMMYCTSSADFASTCIPAVCCGQMSHRAGAFFHCARASARVRMAVAAVVLAAM